MFLLQPIPTYHVFLSIRRRCDIRSILLFAIACLMLTACNQTIPQSHFTPDRNLILEISKPDKSGKNYNIYETIKDAKVATKIKIIVKQADESMNMVSMSRNPDRRISIINTSPTASAEPRVYGIWRLPKSKIAVVSESASGGYFQLNAEDSKKVINVLY